MTRPLESSHEAEFYRLVRSIGGLIFKLAPTEAGLPDRLVILPGGRMFLVELKTETGRTRPIQKVMHERIARRGVEVVLLAGRQEVREWVRTTCDSHWQGDFTYLEDGANVS